MISRRQFNAWLASATLAGSLPALRRSHAGQESQPVRLRAAAIQMAPKLGDAQANLAQAQQLVQEAIGQGAQWIILPEMFTSAAAFHPDLLHCIQPPDGPAGRFLQDTARKSGVVLGGSFLVRDGQQVYNRFMLALPDGRVQHHDKDDPTYWENCFYRGGRDDGILDTPVGPVGSALCWEFIRSRTALRLAGKVRLVTGGSCWWTLPDSAGEDNTLRAENLKILQNTPPRFARLVGAPVIHGSHAGRFEGFFSPDLADVPYHSAYLGEAMITDARGNVLARRSLQEGAGVVMAEVELPRVSVSQERIPERFWIPETMPPHWKDSWQRWLATGRHYYDSVTLPFLQTGEIREYIPEYL